MFQNPTLGTSIVVRQLELLCDRLIRAGLAPVGNSYPSFIAAQNCIALSGGSAPFADYAGQSRSPEDALADLLGEMAGYGQVFMTDGHPYPGLEDAVKYLHENGRMDMPNVITFESPEALYQRLEDLIASAGSDARDAIREAELTIKDCRPGGRFTTEELPPQGAPNYVLERTLMRAIEKLEAALGNQTAPKP